MTPMEIAIKIAELQREYANSLSKEDLLQYVKILEAWRKFLIYMHDKELSKNDDQE